MYAVAKKKKEKTQSEVENPSGGDTALYRSTPWGNAFHHRYDAMRCRQSTNRPINHRLEGPKAEFAKART